MAKIIPNGEPSATSVMHHPPFLQGLKAPSLSATSGGAEAQPPEEAAYETSSSKPRNLEEESVHRYLLVRGGLVRVLFLSPTFAFVSTRSFRAVRRAPVSTSSVAAAKRMWLWSILPPSVHPIILSFHRA